MERRPRAVLRGRAPGRDVHAGRDGDGGADSIDVSAAVVLPGGSGGGGRGRAPAGACVARGAAAGALLGDGAGLVGAAGRVPFRSRYAGLERHASRWTVG